MYVRIGQESSILLYLSVEFSHGHVKIHMIMRIGLEA